MLESDAAGFAHAQPPAATTSLCEPRREFIDAQLRLKRNATAIYQDFDQHSFGDQYNSVKRFVAKLLHMEPAQFDRLSVLPGEEMQVAGQLMAHDALAAHERDELGLSPELNALRAGTAPHIDGERVHAKHRVAFKQCDVMVLLECPSRRQAGDAASNDCNSSRHRTMLTAPSKAKNARYCPRRAVGHIMLKTKIIIPK